MGSKVQRLFREEVHTKLYGSARHPLMDEDIVCSIWKHIAIQLLYWQELTTLVNNWKHYGKTIKRYHYIPLLDDRNFNDQGIDATGSSVANEVTIEITDPAGYSRYAVGTGTTAAAALTAAQKVAEDIFRNLGMTVTSFAAIQASLTAVGWTFTTNPAVNSAGNLYGSSRDVGTITGKLPFISENGGRVNRVGFKRVTMEATMCNFGFFDEYTEDTMQFDSESDLMSHITREALRAANQVVEDCIQMDLLNGANIVFYGGDATDDSTITGEQGVTPSTLDYDTLIKLEIMLDENHCPKDTKIITGSRMIDTKTIGSTRYAYCGNEVKSMLMSMTDYFGNEAFVPIHKYGAAGTLANGEIGAVAGFRFIANPQMMHWEGGTLNASGVAMGAAVTNNDGYMEANGHYNVYPILIVGSGSFTTIGFYSGGGSGGGSEVPVKFKIMHKAPGIQTASREDPYGKTGFYSIQWWYGTAIWRPEWIALIKVVAKK